MSHLDTPIALLLIVLAFAIPALLAHHDRNRPRF